MKNKFFFIICVILFFSCTLPQQNTRSSSGSNKGGNNNKDDNHISYSSNYKFPNPITTLTSRSDVLSMKTGNEYYLDAIYGDDKNGEGIKSKPWQSVSKVQEVLKSGDVVFLADGNYGQFIANRYTHKQRDNYVIFINEKGANPSFTYIYINYSDIDSQIKDAYYLFYGIKVESEYVNPAGDTEWQAAHPGSTNPYYSDSTQETYQKTLDPLRILYVAHLQFINCTIKGCPWPGNKNLTEHAVYMYHTKDITFESCDISGCQAIFQYSDGEYLHFFYNHLHNMCRSCFREGSDLTDVHIEGNYIHNAQWEFSDPWVPRRIYTDYHGSGIAIKDEKHTIRNNIIHNGWTTSGITTYGSEDNIPSSGAYNDILIENNLVYDMREITSTATFYWLGTNVIIRNNTFVGYIREDASGVYRHYATLNVYPTGYKNGQKIDGSGIYIYNNIFAGTTSFSENLWSTIHEDNNIYWAVNSNKNHITQESLESNSKIIVSDTKTNDLYFFDSFFITTPDLSLEHHTWQDFRLSTNSEGVNFGNPAFQSLYSLGSVNSSNFINIDRRERDSSHHSIGCYEK